MLEGINLRSPRLSSPSQTREFHLAKKLLTEADALVESCRMADQTSLDGRDGPGVDLEPTTKLAGFEGSKISATLRGEGPSIRNALVDKKDANGDSLHFSFVANGTFGESEGDRYVISSKDETGRHRYEIVKDRATDTLVMFLDYSAISG